MLSKEFVAGVQDAPGFPGHANEFETSITMHARPENIRVAAIPYSQDEGTSSATAHKGELLVGEIVSGVTAVVEDMLAKTAATGPESR